MKQGTKDRVQNEAHAKGKPRGKARKKASHPGLQGNEKIGGRWIKSSLVQAGMTSGSEFTGTTETNGASLSNGSRWACCRSRSPGFSSWVSSAS